MAAIQRAELRLTDEELFVRHEGDSDAEWWAFAVDAGNALVFVKKDGPPPNAAVRKTVHADAIYGSFQLLGNYSVAIVIKSRRVAKGPYHVPIYQVDEMKWLPVQSKPPTERALTAQEAAEEGVYLQLLREISETRSFYFCGAGYDLTNSLQRVDAALHARAAAGAAGATDAAATDAAATALADAAAAIPGAPAAEAPPVGAVLPRREGAAALPVLPAHCDARFFWNGAALAPVLAAGPAAARFVTPVINGFVAARPCALGGGDGGGGAAANSGVLLLISRRARARQGTRFNVRGADADGSVANFAESEQLLLLEDGRAASYVQVRGSIPLLWEQPVTLKYTPRAAVSAAPAAAQAAAFARHAAVQMARYGAVTAVNLIDRKKDQLALGEAFQAAVAAHGRPAAFGFVWFDFHHECRKMQWHNLSRLLDAVADALAAYGFYAKDARGAVTSVQRGVFRTNCMDNLDRTNVVQSLFARRAALLAVPGAWERTRASGCSVLTSPFAGFEAAFNNAWADNADALSLLYSGTGALKTDFTRTGARTLAGALADGVNSVRRYVLNNLVDGRTQDAWDLFLGRYVPRRLGDAAATAAAAAAAKSGKGERAVTPLAAHLAAMTPAAFFSGSLCLFAGVVAAFALGSQPFLGHTPLATRVSYGLGVAAVVMAGLAYLLVSKGLPIGKQLVSKPQFLRQRSTSAAGSGASGAGAGIALVPLADSGAGGGAPVAEAREKTA